MGGVAGTAAGSVKDAEATRVMFASLCPTAVHTNKSSAFHIFSCPLYSIIKQHITPQKEKDLERN